MGEEIQHYTPLPEGLTINNSSIHGLGLFAIQAFQLGHKFGITHVYDTRFKGKYIRTPLGGFYNHNDKDPNCGIKEEGDFRLLYAIADISPGDELTACYTLYDPTIPAGDATNY